MWNALNKFDRGRFSGSNLLSFDPPLSDVAIDWWRDHIYAQHGLYPEDLGQLLSASATGDKAKIIAVSCCRFDGHRDWVFYQAGGGSCRDGSSVESSRLRQSS